MDIHIQMWYSKSAKSGDLAEDYTYANPYMTQHMCKNPIVVGSDTLCYLWFDTKTDTK